MKSSVKIVFSTKKDNPEFIAKTKNSAAYDNLFIKQYINDGSRSLASIYNEALRENDADYMVFMHDDVFLSDGWLNKLIQQFQTDDWGILGVAGTSVMRTHVWWDNYEGWAGQVYHPVQGKGWVLNSYSAKFDYPIAVCALDGLFIAVDVKKIKKEFIEYAKFHYYDIPFTFANFLEGVKVGVTTAFKVYHQSHGPTNKDWQLAGEKFRNDFGSFFPQKAINLPFVVDTTANPKNKNLTIITLIKHKDEDIDSFLNQIAKSRHKTKKVVLGIYDVTQMQNVNLDNYDFEVKISHVASNKSKTSALNELVRTQTDGKDDYVLFLDTNLQFLNDVIAHSIECMANNESNTASMGIRQHNIDASLYFVGTKIYLKNQQTNLNFDIVHHNAGKLHTYETKGKTATLSNTASFFLTRRNIFLMLGGFNTKVKEAYFDVDFCIRASNRGYNHWVCNTAVAIHQKTKRVIDTNILRMDYAQAVQPHFTNPSNFDKIKQHIVVIK